MGNGTEPRDDDILELVEELQLCRQQCARLQAENTALREAWVKWSNFDRLDFGNEISRVVDEFIKKGSARLALNAAKIASDAA